MEHLIEIITPYLIFIFTLLAHSIQEINNKKPDIRCTIEPPCAFNSKSLILKFSNISDYRILKFEVFPNLEIYCENVIKTKNDILFKGDEIKFLLPYNENLTKIIVRYMDDYKRKYIIEYQIKIETKSDDIVSNYICEINTLIK